MLLVCKLIDSTNSIAEGVQETLLGILGFDDMDFVQDLLTHRDEIVHSVVRTFSHSLTE
jgi:hypothetical protein